MGMGALLNAKLKLGINVLTFLLNALLTVETESLLAKKNVKTITSIQAMDVLKNAK